MPVTAGVGAVGSIVSGLVGNSAAQQARDAAAAARQNAVQQFLSIHVPDPGQLKVELARYQQTGQLSPQLEQTFQQQQSALGGIALDPTSRQAEMDALTKMQGVADAGGLDAQAKAKLDQSMNATNQNAQSQRGAIVQNMAARGMGGSGAELAAQLEAQQGDSNSSARAGEQAAADAEQRALQAMSGAASIGANVRGQDYGQAAEAAKAQDIISRFNTQNSQNVTGSNVDRSNQAASANLQNQQRVSDLNTGVTNEQTQHNAAVNQQIFQDQATRAAGASQQYQAQGNQATADADRTAGQWAGIGQAISGGAGAYGQYKQSQGQLDAYNKRTDAMSGGGSDSGEEESGE